MSLGCGNCRRFDFEAYFMLYVLEQDGGKLDYIDDFERHVSPNCCICPRCAGGAIKEGSKDASGLVSGYALLAASSNGHPQWSDINTDPTTAAYFDAAAARARWPKAMEIIDAMPLLRPSDENAAFVEKLFAHLRGGELRFHRMSELAPGMVIAWDDFGDDRGEMDIYFDAALWGPANPEIWGENGLTPAALKEFGLGVLSEKAYGRPPKNFDEFQHLARQTLAPRSGTAWYDRRRAFKLPRELEA